MASARTSTSATISALASKPSGPLTAKSDPALMAALSTSPEEVAALSKILSRPLIGYRTDGPDGFVPEFGEWTAPAFIAGNLHELARKLARYEAPLSEPASAEVIQLWLLDLMALSGGRKPEEREALQVVEIYTAMLQSDRVPAALLNAASVKAVTRMFPKFFPSYGELWAEFFEPKVTPVVSRQDRLLALATTPTQPERKS